MVKIVAGLKGSGKTKRIMDNANTTVKTAKGNVVFIEKSNQLMYDLDRDIRLVDASEYSLQNYDRFTGFVKGLHAGNYDITHIYIDGLFKIVKDNTPETFEVFIKEIAEFGEKTGIEFFISASMDPSEMGDSKKYII